MDGMDIKGAEAAKEINQRNTPEQRLKLNRVFSYVTMGLIKAAAVAYDELTDEERLTFIDVVKELWKLTDDPEVGDDDRA